VVTIAGSNFDAGTRILFDGHPAAIRSFDEQTGRITVAPPPAASSYRASVVAVNADGQSSLHAQGNLVSTYTYDPGEPSALSISPNALPAGAEAMVEITGVGLNLMDGLASAGFGNSDISVRRVWVTGANRLLANIAIAPGASAGFTTVTVTSGLNVVVQPGVFAIQGATRQVAVVPPTYGVQPGSAVSLPVLNLPAGTTAAALSLSLNDQPVAVSGLANGQISFTVPATLTPGPAVLRLRAGADTAQPVVLGIDVPPPSVAPITAPLAKGETTILTVTGLTLDTFTQRVLKDTVVIAVGGVEHAPQQIDATAQRGVFEVQFTPKDSVPPGAQQLTVSQGSRTSAAVAVTVR
jgi:hypothetical protein